LFYSIDHVPATATCIFSLFFINFKQFKTLPKIYTEIVGRDDCLLAKRKLQKNSLLPRNLFVVSNQPITSSQRQFLSPTKNPSVSQSWCSPRERCKPTVYTSKCTRYNVRLFLNVYTIYIVFPNKSINQYEMSTTLALFWERD
jgi:hypothetical protein